MKGGGDGGGRDGGWDGRRSEDGRVRVESGNSGFEGGKGFWY